MAIEIHGRIKASGVRVFYVRVKCLAQEHNTMSPARIQTQTARSRVKHTNHEAIAPLAMGKQTLGHIIENYMELNVVAEVLTLTTIWLRRIAPRRIKA